MTTQTAGIESVKCGNGKLEGQGGIGKAFPSTLGEAWPLSRRSERGLDAVRLSLSFGTALQPSQCSAFRRN